MRLQKFLARAGFDSRRKCVSVIEEGRVTVNGKTAPPTGCIVDPETDVICVDGVEWKLPEETVVIMLNKPKGYDSSMEDDHAQHLVTELVPVNEYPGLYHVGRLDKDTTGLLLFTNDGELGHALMHPSKHVDKRYIAKIEGHLSKEDIHALEHGVLIDDGMTAPAKVQVLKDGVAITIHEGRNRQVRKMFKAVGHPVKELHRQTLGPLNVEDLPEGQWRLLEDAEIDVLRKACTKTGPSCKIISIE